MKFTTYRAGLIAGRVEQAQFDPMTILIVISIIVNLVKIWKECKKPDTPVTELANAAPLLMKRRARRYAKTRVLKEGLSPSLINPLADESLKELNSMSEPEIRQVISECDAHTETFDDN